MSACFVACFAVFAPQILHLFIPEAETSTLGASFLRIACLAVPLTSVNFFISLTEEEMAKIAALDKNTRYYTSTPEMLEMYAKTVPDVDGQK